MSKTAVYSWRLTPDLKAALERAARDEHQSVSQLLDKIARDWLSRSSNASDEAEQQRLHAAARSCFGTIDSGDPDRSTRVRSALRDRLRHRHGRAPGPP